MTAHVISVGRRPRRWPWVVAGAIALGVAALGIGLGDELDSSRWQARWLVEHARTLRFDLRPGAQAAMRVPAHGPFDERMGYTQLPEHVQRLVARGYEVTLQARQSARVDVTHRPRAVRPLPREDAGWAVGARLPRRHAIRQPLPATCLDTVRRRAAAGARQPVVHRGPRSARRRRGDAQPGDRPAAAGARGLRPTRQAHRRRLFGRRWQHAGHADREVPPFARRPHRRRARQAAPDRQCLVARLCRR